MKIKVTDIGKVIASIIVLILWIVGVFDWKMFLLYALATVTLKITHKEDNVESKKQI